MKVAGTGVGVTAAGAGPAAGEDAQILACWAAVWPGPAMDCAHGGVGLDVLHAVVVHDAEVAVAEGLGHGERAPAASASTTGRASPGRGRPSPVRRPRPAARRTSAWAWAMSLSASACSAWSLAPTFSPTSTSAMSIERISKAVLRVERLVEHGLGDAVGVFEHVLVAVGGADGGDDAFADAGDDGFLGGAADEAVEVGAHGDAGLDLDGDAVLGDGVDGGLAGGGVGAVDDLGVDEVLHGVEHGLAGALGGEVDGAGAVEVEVDAGLAGRRSGPAPPSPRRRRPGGGWTGHRWKPRDRGGLPR